MLPPVMLIVVFCELAGARSERSQGQFDFNLAVAETSARIESQQFKDYISPLGHADHIQEVLAETFPIPSIAPIPLL